MGNLINWIQIILIGTYTTLSAVLGFVLLPLGQRRALYTASQVWSWLIVHTVGLRLTIYGRDRVRNLPPAIFISNHASHLDIPCLFLAVPHALFFVAKKELRKIPFMGWYMRAVGMVFLDRSNREQALLGMRKAGEEIKRGKHVLSFPEGTRTKTGQVGLFKRGAFLLAKENNIPLVPVGVTGTYEALPSGSLYLRAQRVTVTIGEPFSPEEVPHSSVEELAAYAQERVQELMQTEHAQTEDA